MAGKIERASHIKENTIVPLHRLFAHPENYRVHPPAQIANLVASLTRFGQGRSIVCQDSPEHLLIVAGHGVVEAARKLDWQELRADILPADWTPTQVKGYLIADNMLSEQAEDDTDVLARLLQEQQNAGYALAALGSDDETLRQMLETLGDGYAGEQEESDGAEDELPEEVETRCKPGDIWQLGDRHKLIVGNSFDVEVLNTLMGNEKADLLFGDPPYGMNFDPGMSMIGHNKGNWEHKPRHYDKVIGDDRDFDPRLFMEYFGYCKEQFWWGADYYAERIPDRNKGAWFVWDKREGLEEVEFTLSSFELCWSRQKHTREIIRQRWMGLIGTETQDIRNRVHPTQKALQTCSFFIEKFSKLNDLIIDLFLGSGTTIISCERLGRRCYGCEIEPKFADIVLTRWEAESGEQAILLQNVIDANRSECHA